MNKEIFIERKKELITLINNNLTEHELDKQKEMSLIKLEEIVNQYYFENRLEKKGLLSHTIVDSSKLDYSMGEKFIKFDNDIR